MHAYPALAAALIHRMAEAAAADPARAIAFQGAPGCNSHRAAGDWAAGEAAPAALPLPCFSFEDALEAVKDGRAGRAIIPIENSQHGRVADIHFLLPESGLFIVGEVFLRISHALMAVPGAKGPFAAAYSHPQALGQSRRFLREWGIVPLAYADTAGAAAFVAEQGDGAAAAIAPVLAAELYGLDIVADAVEDAADNTTRFVVLARAPNDVKADAAKTASGEAMTKPAMTTIVYRVRNQPAALYKALGGFATNGINVTKLESYQQGASFAATMFYQDFIGAPGEPAVDRALSELAFHCDHLRVLGSYRQALLRG